ncbi:MAG: AAA family ATPase [Acetatifactor sp.]|nr:AAA family ATPase [Acetatifactor sp.]
MQKFLARINLSYPFAESKMQELGGFWTKLLQEIPDIHEPQLSQYRFTFASYVLNAETQMECRQVLSQAWKKVFGTLEGYSEIIVCEQNEDDISSVMKAIYNNFYGVEDYQRLVTEMTAQAPLLTKRNAMDVLRKQSYLLAIDNGCGFTTLLSSLGDYLVKLKVYPNEDEDARRQYLEIELGAETEKGVYSQDDFIEMLQEAANEAKTPYGVIGLDVSYYLEGKKYDELRRFLRRLEHYQASFVFMFRIPFLEKRAFDEVKNLFTDIALLRTIQVPPIADTALMESAWDILNSKGFILNVSILDLMLERVHQEKMDGRFYGFKSIEKIANEMILLKSADYAAKIARGDQADEVNFLAADVKDLVDGKKQQATGYAALKELIGMEDIEAKVREMIAQVKVAMTNEKLDRPCIHMRFTGAPGTGKTTVARIIGQIMREEGILRKGGFFEYTGRDLVAEYVGQTAVKTASICRDSYGSVLFIDEAYALYDGDQKTNDFGREALTTLISEMENHRDDMLVVMAGYTDEMDTLMTANPGLRSRMPRILHFPNYSKEQLFEIFMFMVKKHFEYTPELEEEAKRYFMGLSQEYMDSKEFANARFVRNLYERTWSKAALRCSLAGLRDITLAKEDFIAASGEKEFGEKIERKKVLGF